MRCKHVRKLMTDYLDGWLRSGKAGRVRRHLALCEDCRRAEEEALMVAAALADWPDATPPEDGLHRIETRLAFLPLLAPPAPRARLLTLGVPYVAGLATAAVLLLVVLPLLPGSAGPAPVPLPAPAPAVAPPSEVAGGGATAPAGAERPLRYAPADLYERSPDFRRLLERLPREDREELDRMIRAVGYERDW